MNNNKSVMRVEGKPRCEFLFSRMKALLSVALMPVMTFVIIVVLMSVSICGCDEVGKGPSIFSSPPPIGVTFREGFLSDNVMQVHNLSDKRIIIHIHASYPPTSEVMDMEFPIAPNSTEEYGCLEMNWKFSPGGCGYVAVQGCPGRVNYEILKDKYRTW